MFHEKLPFEWELVRSRRKTVGITVKRGGIVIVRAPLRYPQREIERLLRQDEERILKAMAKLDAMPARPEYTPAQIRQMKASIAARVVPMIETYAERMGLYPTALSITSARTRWGSCNAENKLCFSYYLDAMPDRFVEAVVVHELAHIAIKNHSRDFYALVEGYLPDYRKRIKER